jgi:hypothetical protein
MTQMIKANKTFTITIPKLAKEFPERTMVRTGTYADGNCFFHALLRAIDNGYRRQNSYHLHLKLVERFRRDIAEWITPEWFNRAGNEEHLRFAFLTELNGLLRRQIEQAEDHPSPVIRVIYKLVTIKDFEEQLIPEAMKHDNFYISFCRSVEQLVRQKLVNVDPTKVQSLCNQMYTHFIQLFQLAHSNHLENFKSKFSKMGEYTDSTQIQCIAQYTGYNFIFIRNDQDNELYSGLSHVVAFDSNRKGTIVFLWVDKDHFEIIGELEGNNMINRVFNSDDPLVQLLANVDNS